MYKETRENPRQKKAVLLAAGAVCLVCFSVLWFTVDLHFAAPLQLLCLAVCGIAVYYIVRYALRSYTYALEDGVLTLLLQDSSRLPVLEEIPLRTVTEFALLPPDGAKKASGEKQLDYRFSFFREDKTWFLRFYRDGQAFLVLFQPSDTLVEKIGGVLHNSR
ncbi:MAG: hypothetical protein IJC53_08470 [Clostridia bacterium]|nr:hypothetical protein [Clostridia bacterium]